MSALNDLVVRLLITGQDRTGPAVRSTRQGITSISGQLQALQSVARRFLDFRLFAGWAQDTVKLSDAYKGLTGRLKQVTTGTSDLERMQQSLFNLAQRTQIGLRDTVNLYVRTSAALKNYANGQQKAAQLTEVVNLSFKAQSSNAAEVSSTVTQLTQAIAGGAVQWEDFGSLADTNLLLVNTAAKNLGFDGIDSLKKAMSAGLVSGIQLTDALIAGFDEIKSAADAMPVSVEAAWTTLNNALLKYVGESKNASSATASLSSGIQLLANNIEPLVQVGVLLAEVYLVRLVAGFLASASAQVKSTQAAREAATAIQFQLQAEQRSLQVKAQLLAIQQRIAAGLIQEARLQVAMAATESQRTLAVKRLTAAIQGYKVAVANTNAVNQALRGGLDSTTTAVSRADKAMAALSGVMSLMLAYDIGKTFGQWLTHFEAVRVAGSYLAETFALIESGAKAMLDDTSLAERFEQIKKIHADFDAIRESSTDSAVQHVKQQSAAEERKAKATEEAAERQAAAYEVVKQATEELTKIIDAEAKTQTQVLQDEYQQRLLDIDQQNISEGEKNQQRFDAQLLFSQQEADLQREAAAEKLLLIESQYNKEIERAKVNKERIAQLESEKRQAKLSVYTGLAEFYQGEVNRLRGVYQNEINAAQQSRDALANLARQHEKNLFDIKLGGLDKRDQLYEQEKRFNELVAEANKEIAKGQQGDQTKINTLLDEARGLHGKISSAAGKGSTALYKAKKREDTLYDAQKTVLEDNAKAHEKSADRAKTAIDETATSLAAVQTSIDKISSALKKEFLLKIGIDQSSLSQAQSVIAQLTAPATKVITIITKNAPQQAQNGGPIVGFNQGGFAPLAGKLPGFGGGDKVKALLEAGEFIIRKEAVQKLGLSFMQQVNTGQAPDAPIKRATGGPVGLEKLRLNRAAETPALLEQLKQILDDQRTLQQQFSSHRKRVNFSRRIANGRPTDSGAVASLATTRAEIDLLYKDMQRVLASLKKLGHTARVTSMLDRFGKLDIRAFLDGNPLKFATGGLVPGSGNKDTVPAMLTPGEFILKKTAVNALGADFVQMLNNGISPVARFAATNGGGASSATNRIEKIDISLSIGGQSATGRFDDNSGTQALLDELRQSGMVSS